MYKYIVLCLCVSLSGVLCNLDEEEGAPCMFDGVKGKCVKETQCLTTLDKRSDPHPVCSSGTTICCTDCELVNDTRNVVFSPNTDYYWKDGSKARDSCLQYLDTLPYRCRDGGSYSGISKSYDEEKKCHTIGFWRVGGSPLPDHEPGAKYPHQALLAYGEDFASAKWIAGGSIISDKYILTTAQVQKEAVARSGGLKFVALGVKKWSDGPSAWQTHTVKRVIIHPDYRSPMKYHDIALVELDDTITFNKDVLPACLQVEAADDETAIATTWRNLSQPYGTKYVDTIQTINVDKFSEEECASAYSRQRHLKQGIDFETQMCYGSKSGSSDACKGLSGEPLLVSTQFSSCIYTIIGVTSFGQVCRSEGNAPDVYTRVAHYKTWIESVVWP